ncbi:DUF5374 domain-containing protein [Mannheimia haemolytica]|uniref:DUF5374 domain-containing protein n=1 Tax=Mannheimia haemolytica TaxID=75985 RepID=UPI00115CE873|nr:DUF5374 domain-containing protein [Mannheimia haemolytica]TRC47833.1 hypothetical protein FEA40_08115 [Mannheimia haemolytica]TRC48352.1 hypothetical protein FEA32_08135 [Mannheimia haemolytica]
MLGNLGANRHLLLGTIQAVMILENQLALKLAGLDCESSITQNQIRYQIQCPGNRLTIRFPLGKIELNND